MKITADNTARKVAENLRYQQRTADDVRVFNNWQYSQYWRARNAAGTTETSKATP